MMENDSLDEYHFTDRTRKLLAMGNIVTKSQLKVLLEQNDGLKYLKLISGMCESCINEILIKCA